MGSSGTAGRDDQHRPRGGRADRIAQGHGAGSAAEQPGGAELDPFLAAGQRTVNPVGKPAVVGELLTGHALGHHGPDPRVGARRRDGLLPAHRQAEHGDLPRPDARLAAQERHGRGDVGVAMPAEVHRPPAAEPVPPGVGEQRPVAMPGQHGGLPEYRGAGGSGAR
jgi:hypothetical protein